MKLIVASEADSTSRLVAEILIESYGFKLAGGKLYRMGEIFLKLISERHIYADGLAEDLAPELLVVASSHRSEAGKRALLTHPVGNWGEEALMGGLPRTLSPTSASALYTALHSLREKSSDLGLEGWSVGLEVTHHGPATGVPIIFVEAGGPPDEVPERKALEVVASACFNACRSSEAIPPAAIGFGGGHYAPSFTRLALSREYSFGHMCPKYAMPIDRDLIIQALEKTIENPSIAVLDWKGLKSRDREIIISALRDLGVEWIRA